MAASHCYFIQTADSFRNEIEWVIESFMQPIRSKSRSFSKETSTVCCLETHNSAVVLFQTIIVGKTEQKQAIWCLQFKSLNIDFFIEHV